MSEGLPRKRPARACTARTPQRLAPLAPTVEKTSGQKKPSSANTEPPAPLVLSVTPPPEQKPRWELRSMWELASVVNFLNTFRLLLKLDFTVEELESALLVPNRLLDDIHIAVLKGIPPISRVPVTRDNWVTIMCKKLKGHWAKVDEGDFPLAAPHGEEMSMYKELDPPIRVIILRALCEVRADQDDTRVFMEETLKQNYPMSVFRKERSGADPFGTTYWIEDDPVSGHRLYRELRTEPKFKGKIRGRAVSPPNAGQWETLASNIEEFQIVADKLSSSRNKQEVSLGKKIKSDIIPAIEEIQRKKEKALKKQQRQAMLLESAIQLNGGIAGGRSRRDRKPVTYTFDEYDRSITEAIKYTKKRGQSPDDVSRHDDVERHDDMGQDAVSIHKEVDTISNHDGSSPKPDAPESDLHIVDNGCLDSEPSDLKGKEPVKEPSDNSEEETLEDDSAPSRRRRRSQRYSESDYVDAVFDDDESSYSDDEIEGEAIYDDEFVKTKNKRRNPGSSDADEEYRGEEDVDMDEDEDEILSSSEDELLDGRSTRRVQKQALKDGPRSGLRRSQRATKSTINYSAIDDSEEEGNDPGPERYKAATRRKYKLDDYSDSESGENDQEDNESSDSRSDRVVTRKHHGPSSNTIANGDRPKRRFFDLNQSATAGSGHDDPSKDSDESDGGIPRRKNSK